MDMTDIIKKIRTLAETDAACNMTNEGEYCPVHGMEECWSAGSMEEADMDEADAFTVAAAAAAAENKSHFEFPKGSGKMHPVSMDKGTAKQIVDEESVDWDPEMLELFKKYGVDDAHDDDHSHHDHMHDEPMMGMDDEEMDEDVHITVDGEEAQSLIDRLISLSGGMPTPRVQDGVDMDHPGAIAVHGTMDAAGAHEFADELDAAEHGHDHEEECPDCGMPMQHCICDEEDMTMETADHDHGHELHPARGEEVDADTYMYRAPNGPQRFGKLGDNTLDMHESVDVIKSRLKKDYRAYISEAELASSNAGADSPLTANSRNEFDKDPFAGEEPVTDGSRSPLSTVKRQKALK
jgi:hypothetical protein